MPSASRLAGLVALLGSLQQVVAQAATASAKGDLVVFTAASSETCSRTPMAWTWSGDATDLTISIGVQPVTGASTVNARSLGDKLSGRMVHRRAGSSPPIVIKRAVQVYTKVAGGVPITQNMFYWSSNVAPGSYRYVVSVEGAGIVSFSDTFSIVAGEDTSCVSGGNALTSSSSVTDATSTAVIPSASSTLASIPRDPTTTAPLSTSSSVAASSSSSSLTSSSAIRPSSASTSIQAIPTVSPTSDASNSPTSSGGGSHSNSGAIAAGIVVPLLALAALVLLLLYRRRRRAQGEGKGGAPSWDEKYGPGGRARASHGRSMPFNNVGGGDAGAHAHSRSLSAPVSIDGMKMAENPADYYSTGFDESDHGHHTLVIGGTASDGADAAANAHPNGAAPPYTSPNPADDHGGSTEILRNSSSGSAGSRYRRLLLPATVEAREHAAQRLALTSRFSNTTAATMTTMAGGSEAIVSPVDGPGVSAPTMGLFRSLSTSSALNRGANATVAGAGAVHLNRSLSSGSMTNIRRKPVKYSLSVIGDANGGLPAVPTKEVKEETDVYSGLDDADGDFEIPIKDISSKATAMATGTVPSADHLRLPSPTAEEMGASNRSSKDPYSPAPEWTEEQFGSMMDFNSGSSQSQSQSQNLSPAPRDKGRALPPTPFVNCDADPNAKANVKAGAAPRDDSASPFSDAQSVSLPLSSEDDVAPNASSSSVSQEVEALQYPRPAFLNSATSRSHSPSPAAYTDHRSSATSVSLPYMVGGHSGDGGDGEGKTYRPPSHAGSERFPRSVREGIDSIVGAFPMPGLSTSNLGQSIDAPPPLPVSSALGRSSPAPYPAPASTVSTTQRKDGEEGKQEQEEQRSGYKIELNVDRSSFGLLF